MALTQDLIDKAVEDCVQLTNQYAFLYKTRQALTSNINRTVGEHATKGVLNHHAIPIYANLQHELNEINAAMRKIEKDIERFIPRPTVNEISFNLPCQATPSIGGGDIRGFTASYHQDPQTLTWRLEMIPIRVQVIS